MSAQHLVPHLDAQHWIIVCLVWGPSPRLWKRALAEPSCIAAGPPQWGSCWGAVLLRPAHLLLEDWCDSRGQPAANCASMDWIACHPCELESSQLCPTLGLPAHRLAGRHREQTFTIATTRTAHWSPVRQTLLCRQQPGRAGSRLWVWPSGCAAAGQKGGSGSDGQPPPLALGQELLALLQQLVRLGDVRGRQRGSLALLCGHLHGCTPGVGCLLRQSLHQACGQHMAVQSQAAAPFSTSSPTKTLPMAHSTMPALSDALQPVTASQSCSTRHN